MPLVDSLVLALVVGVSTLGLLGRALLSWLKYRREVGVARGSERLAGRLEGDRATASPPKPSASEVLTGATAAFE